MRVAVGVSALLISVQVCLAADGRRQIFEGHWSLFGEKAKAELAALPEKGRSAFRETLIACSLYADEYFNGEYKTKCERALKFFVIEFGRPSSTIELLFKGALAMTHVQASQVELDQMHGQRDITDDDTRKGFIDVLEKAYRETRERK
jgi:hypothetical protein